MEGTIGTVKIKTLYEETEIEWEISDFFSEVGEGPLLRKSPFFCFANSPWCLLLFGTNILDHNFMALYLGNYEKREYSTECCFGIKKHNGDVEHLFSLVMHGYETRTEPWKFIKRSEVLQRKLELAPFGNFTITCKLKCDPPVSSIQSTALDKQKVGNLRKLDVLSENLKTFSANKDSCDTVLQVKDREFKAHKFILMSRSSTFAAMFQHDTLEKQTGVVKIPDCDPESFQEFLDYLYCGKLEDVSYNSAFQLYITSNKYDVLELKEYCVEYLIGSLTVNNVCEIVILSDRYDEEKLLSAAQDFFIQNWKQIFKTSEWENLLKSDYRLVHKLLIELSNN